ncbi:hypothetical protein CYMTET_31187 [Cymbomonas tetramitiformis]|uniref:WLM domain-containing protein n=1 Tax=Cymbomonas tetramitiformis TaxID=36881 RepID=A0AAE0KT79_9CHLO|nr:hypothetical protein CYMTET_31187 [Cymbomonas tetramitiformis]
MSNTAPSADEYKAQVIKTLGKIRDEEARETLNRAAKQVQPLMRRRQWKVGVLLEFYPKSDCLLGLNVNHGQQVKVRLRPPGNESDFYPYEHILGTLLHELTHIKVSPHNAAFYKLLDEITQECEDDMAKGISGTGVGFDANSMGRLGGRVYDHNPDPARLRQVMAEAASKRSQQNALMPSGGKRLGGNTSATSHLTPAQAAARAAERRQRDDIWCGDEGQEKAPPQKATACNPRRDSALLKENTRNVGGQRGVLHPQDARPNAVHADVKGKGKLWIRCACCASGPSMTCRLAEAKQAGEAEQAPIDLTFSEDEDDVPAKGPQVLPTQFQPISIPTEYRNGQGKQRLMMDGNVNDVHWSISSLRRTVTFAELGGIRMVRLPYLDLQDRSTVVLTVL